MSRNIKEIGKELLGKSLNSFHRKTGLTQLEENNKMQDGILDGILSQVDDAYIEKTEQSNVIHLDGSGDGVVVLDGVEGNTMVNLIKTNMKNFEVVSNNAKNFDVVNLKPSTTYTFVAHLKDVCSTNVWLARFHFNKISNNSELYINVAPYQTYTSNSVVKYSFTTPNNDYVYKRAWALWNSTLPSGEKMSFHNALVLEGDWTDKEVPINLQGLQSSFEEQIEDDKYKIEILSNNRNLLELYDTKSVLSENGLTVKILNKNEILINGTTNTTYTWVELLYNLQSGTSPRTDKIIPLNKNFKYTLSSNIISGTVSNLNSISFSMQHKNIEVAVTCNEGNNFNTTFDGSDGAYRLWLTVLQGVTFNNCVISLQLEKGEVKTSYTANKQNKIKLLINEPLRGLSNGTKDELCIKDDKLVIKRRCGETTLKDMNIGYTNGTYLDIFNFGTIGDKYNVKTQSYMTCDKFPYVGDVWNGCQAIGIGGHNNINFRITYPKETMTIDSLTQWLQKNQTTVVYELAEPIYEEVLNEYGEPILLEGYENGTIYIDSTIVPTTTVRYTPKMESFKVLKEVNNNNIMLTNDIDDNIIPYMMDVDLMIMEKEMALTSHKNIRTIGVKDMTSMQKRTQDMLTRLIKGKTLTEQECKTRVTTYLNAGKITDAQAEELNFLIDEIYA